MEGRIGTGSWKGRVACGHTGPGQLPDQGSNASQTGSPGNPSSPPWQDVAALMILNESQLRHTSVPPPLAVLDATVTVRYQDIGKVPQLEAAVTGRWCGAARWRAPSKRLL